MHGPIPPPPVKDIGVLTESRKTTPGSVLDILSTENGRTGRHIFPWSGDKRFEFSDPEPGREGMFILNAA